MKKSSKLAIIVAMVAIVIMSVVLVGCQSTKQKPIGATNPGVEAVGNGNVIVEQGGVIYYVNGQADTTTIKKPKDNYFGKADIKASIMKANMAADGTITDIQKLVPKMFYAKSKMGGLYIFGEWLYYTSPSTKTNNLGEVQVTTLEVMRTKTDGTATQTIGFVADSVDYVITANCMVYFEGGKLTKINYDDQKILDTVMLDEEITAVTFTPGSANIFYTKGVKDTDRANNELYVCKSGAAPVNIINGNTFAAVADDPTFAEQKTITVVSYDPKENVLYFTSKDNGGDHADITATYGYKFGENFDFNKDGMIKYSNTALSGLVYIGASKGVMVVKESKINIYNAIGANDNDSKSEPLTLGGTAVALFFKTIDGVEYFYYHSSGNIFRIPYMNEKGVEEKLTEDAMGTASAPSVIGNHVYFMGATYNYLYRINLADYSQSANSITRAKQAPVNGFEDNEKTKDGTIPKFMSKKDIKTYIEANPVEKEEK